MHTLLSNMLLWIIVTPFIPASAGVLPADLGQSQKSVAGVANAPPVSAYVVPMFTLKKTSNHEQFVVNAKINNDVVPLVLDTGSAEITCTRVEFKCTPRTKQQQQRPCQKVPTCKSPYSALHIKENGQDRGTADLELQYGDGTRIEGELAKTVVQLGGFTSKDQTALMVKQGWTAELGGASGLFGLGLEPATDPSQGVGQTPSFIDQARRKNQPGFSISFRRDSWTDGTLAIGGIPPSVATFGQTACTRFVEVQNGQARAVTNPLDYRVRIDDIKVKSTGQSIIGPSEQEHTAVLDTGTPTMVLSAAAAQVYNDLWNPAAGQAAPELVVTIGGIDFTIAAKDLVAHTQSFADQSLVLPNHSPNDEQIFGQPFLRNVLAYFDLAVNNERMLLTSTNPDDGDKSSMNYVQCAN